MVDRHDIKAQVAPLTKQLGDLEKRLSKVEQGQSTSQLNNASLTNSNIKMFAADGETQVGSVGIHADGGLAVVNTSGPIPPTPSRPSVFPTIAGLTAAWDGLAADADVMTSDFDHIEVHVSDVSGFTPDDATKQGIIPRVSGSFPVTGLTGGTEYYVVFVAVSSAGVSSDPSAESSATALDAPTGDGGGGDTLAPGIPTVSGTIPVSTYVDASGDARSMAVLSWDAPTTNADGSPLTDGSYFEIQFRPTTPAGSPWRSVYVAWGDE